MNKLLKNNNVLAILISCIIVFILFSSSSFFRVLNKSIQNKYYDVKSSIVGLTAHPQIIIVELDEKSFESVWKFPFPRSVYATFLDNLKPYSVATIGLDILFLDPSDEWEDTSFIQALKNTSRVVLWASINHHGIVQTPIFDASDWVYASGFLPPNIESSNNTVYSFTPLLRDAHQEVYEHFSIQLLRAYYSYYWYENLTQAWQYTKREYVFSDTQSYPLSSYNSDEILINFIPPDNFHRVSFSDIYDLQSLELISQSIDFTDAILLVWPAADGLKDEFFTPNGVEYWVNIHANILNTLLQEEFAMYFNKNLEWLLIFCLVILSVYANLSSSNKVLLISNFCIVGIFWFIFPLSILIGTNLIINFPSEIIFSLLLSFAFANIVKYLIEDINKQKLNQALSEYVGSNIADEILLENGKVNLDGQEKNLVCFFSDIEGFTSISEKLSPRELVAFLREYLSGITSIIMDKNGHVDKYQWDAVMALWWAFSQHCETDYTLACESALLQKSLLQKINATWSEKFTKEIKVRIWIHGGKSIIWNIWALWRKMEFTALGDNINLASRLEWVNKYYGTYICVSDVVYHATKESFEFRYLDEIQVQWKDNPIHIYELIWKKWVISETQRNIYSEFMGAIKLYRNKNFSKARDIFENLIKDNDSPSKIYLERCEYYLKNPPSKDWNWIWKMKEK